MAFEHNGVMMEITDQRKILSDDGLMLIIYFTLTTFRNDSEPFVEPKSITLERTTTDIDFLDVMAALDAYYGPSIQ
jgi:hypothetical protein